MNFSKSVFRQGVLFFVCAGGVIALSAAAVGARNYLHLPVRNPVWNIPTGHLPSKNPRRSRHQAPVEQGSKPSDRVRPRANIAVPANETPGAEAEKELHLTPQRTAKAKPITSPKPLNKLSAGKTAPESETEPRQKRVAPTVARAIEKVLSAPKPMRSSVPHAKQPVREAAADDTIEIKPAEIKPTELKPAAPTVANSAPNSALVPAQRKKQSEQGKSQLVAKIKSGKAEAESQSLNSAPHTGQTTAPATATEDRSSSKIGGRLLSKPVAVTKPSDLAPKRVVILQKLPAKTTRERFLPAAPTAVGAETPGGAERAATPSVPQQDKAKMPEKLSKSPLDVVKAAPVEVASQVAEKTAVPAAPAGKTPVAPAGKTPKESAEKTKTLQSGQEKTQQAMALRPASSAAQINAEKTSPENLKTQARLPNFSQRMIDEAGGSFPRITRYYSWMLDRVLPTSSDLSASDLSVGKLAVQDPSIVDLSAPDSSSGGRSLHSASRKQPVPSKQAEQIADRSPVGKKTISAAPAIPAVKVAAAQKIAPRQTEEKSKPAVQMTVTNDPATPLDVKPEIGKAAEKNVAVKPDPVTVQDEKNPAAVLAAASDKSSAEASGKKGAVGGATGVKKQQVAPKVTALPAKDSPDKTKAKVEAPAVMLGADQVKAVKNAGVAKKLPATPQAATPSTAVATVTKPAVVAAVSHDDAASLPAEDQANANNEQKPLTLAQATLLTGITFTPERPTVKTKKVRFAAIDKLLSKSLTAEDKENLQEAIYATYLRKYERTLFAIPKIRNSAARGLAKWYYLRRMGLGGSYRELEEFRRTEPNWPNQKRMRKRVERMIAGSENDPLVIKKFFAESPAETGAGIAAKAYAELKSGNKKQATTLIREAWRYNKLDRAMEERILEHFGDILTKSDHKARMHYFLYKNRTGYYIDAALRMADLVGKTRAMPILKARSAVIHMDNTRGTKRKIWEGRHVARYKKLSVRDRRDWGVRFNRIQYLRRKKKYNKAWQLLLSAPTKRETLINPIAWWKERYTNARYALNAGKARLAYRFVSKHDGLSQKYLQKAEFFSGWIALRFLAEPKNAMAHFKRMRAAASSRRSTAKAEYWLGRALEQQKGYAAAKPHYKTAAQYTHVYYGQLALQKLAPGLRRANYRDLPLPTKAETQSFLKTPAVLGLMYAYKSEKRGLIPLFFNHLAWNLKKPGELVLLNALAKRIGSKQITVRVGKIAVFRGFAIDHYAYPNKILPKFRRLLPADKEVEPALLHALIRQESEFNFRAKSWVGATGLMQFMPGTAKSVARQFKQRGHKTALLLNPKYNLMLGNAHLSDLVHTYRGSYILTLCAYNAGGPRVSQWIKAFGDPRTDSIDPIDWVERIPFRETRQYVKRIMASTQIFRARFDKPETAMRLYDDLHLGARPSALDKAPISDAAAVSKKEG